MFANAVAIIAFVGEQGLWLGNGQCHQGIDCFVIGGFPACQDKAERAPLIVTAGVDLARKAAAASTKTLLMSPPFAPAACE